MSALARHDDGFSREQIETLKSVLCPGLTDAELGLVQEVCRQTQLSPFARQIHVTKRPMWDAESRSMVPKLTIQTGIDGYRLVAERTGKYDGQDAPQWCGRDGRWVDVWLQSGFPAAARVTVHKANAKPTTAIARWDAYVQTKKDQKSGQQVPNSMWMKMGPEQLAKCAEALALRKAFPQELSGLYTQEEMAQAELQATVLDNAPPDTEPEKLPPVRALPPPAANDEPPALPTMLAKNYPVKAIAGTPFGSCPMSELTKYIAYYEQRGASVTQDNHRVAIELTLRAAHAEVARRIDMETGEVSEPAPEDDFRAEATELDGPSASASASGH